MTGCLWRDKLSIWMTSYTNCIRICNCSRNIRVFPTKFFFCDTKFGLIVFKPKEGKGMGNGWQRYNVMFCTQDFKSTSGNVYRNEYKYGYAKNVPLRGMWINFFKLVNLNTCLSVRYPLMKPFADLVSIATIFENYYAVAFKCCI